MPPSLKIIHVLATNKYNKKNAESSPDKMVIEARAPIAPTKIVSRECRIAIIAAMKKVLSPSSETMITEIAATKPWRKPSVWYPFHLSSFMVFVFFPFKKL